MVINYLKILALEVSQPPKNFPRFLHLLIFFLIQNKPLGSRENCCPDGKVYFCFTFRELSFLSDWAEVTEASGFCQKPQPGLFEHRQQRFLLLVV